MNKLILGGGFAGLIAGCHFTDAIILERGKFKQQHQALLRFRDERVSKLTGIPFKEVKVQKAVFDDGKLIYGACGFNLQNQYSIKVTGNLISRSINNLSPSVRYIAPDYFYEELVAKLGSRIHFQHPFQWGDIISGNDAFISTIPLPQMLEMLHIDHDKEMFKNDFNATPIRVDRWRLNFDVCDVYQTVYFPDMQTPVYRASITGNELIMESMDEIGWERVNESDVNMVFEAFGLSPHCAVHGTRRTYNQPNGKIVALERGKREALLYKLTNEYNIFSLGRFATWRNILLDDVAGDIDVIDRLINSSNYYRNLLK